MKIFYHTFLLPLVFISLYVYNTALAVSDYDIDATVKYHEVFYKMSEFKKRTPRRLIFLFDDSNRKARNGLKKKERLLRVEYIDLKSSLLFWKRVSDLKIALIESLKKHDLRQFERDKESILSETNKIAIRLIEGISPFSKLAPLGANTATLCSTV